MGGAVVFPGGKLDEGDRDPRWRACAGEPVAASFAPDADTLRALAVAACRESFEEAAMLPLEGAALPHEELIAMRATKEPLLDVLEARALRLDLAALRPLARWITPTPDSPRVDARCFLY